MYEVLVRKADRGWFCDVLFTTNEGVAGQPLSNRYQVAHRFFLVALLRGIIGARRERKRIERAARERQRSRGFFDWSKS